MGYNELSVLCLLPDASSLILLSLVLHVNLLT